MKKISIVISVFNEESNIQELVKEINKSKNPKFKYEIIFYTRQSIIIKSCRNNNIIFPFTFFYKELWSRNGNERWYGYVFWRCCNIYGC